MASDWRRGLSQCRNPATFLAGVIAGLVACDLKKLFAEVMMKAPALREMLGKSSYARREEESCELGDCREGIATRSTVWSLASIYALQSAAVRKQLGTSTTGVESRLSG